MTRKRRILIAGAVGFVLALIYAGVIVHTGWTALEYRRHPTRRVVQSFFRSEWPHNLLARAIVFKSPGSGTYWLEVYDSVFRNCRVADNFWNRWILERHVLKHMSTEDRVEFLPDYPISPTKRLYPVLMEFLNSEDGYRILPVLTGAPGGPEACLTWLKSQPKGRQEDCAPENVIPYLLAVPGAPIAEWANTHFFLDPEGKPVSYPITLQISLPFKPGFLGAVEANAFLAWMEDSVATNKVIPDSFLAYFLGSLAACAEARERAERFMLELDARQNQLRASHALDREEDPFYGESPLGCYLEGIDDSYLRMRIALDIFRREALTRPECAVNAFRVLYRLDPIKAESEAAPILKQDDSILRKGVIVLLSRNRSRLGIKYLDQAFTGTAPRRTYFISVETYLFGSRATADYETICGHGYAESAKSYPPSQPQDLSYATEMKKWPGFIQRYPWFPGTDDAYYRLAYARLKSGDRNGALQCVIEYSSREFPDVDAEPYLVQVLAELMEIDEETAGALFRNPEELRELQVLLTGSGP